MGELTSHELADIFPRMSESEFEGLVDSIADKGQVDPIWLYEGQILDGRHRYRACMELGLAPRTREYDGGDPLGFVVALNLERRHLTTEQKAALGVELKRLEAKRAKERQGTRTDIVENFPQGSEGKARDLAGERVGVSGRTIDKVEKITKKAPDVAERMKDGAYGSVRTAERVSQMPEPARNEVHQRMSRGESARDVLKSFDRDAYSTPEWVVDIARDVLGEIDLDPATNEKAQAEVVKARHFYTKEQDGLAQPWHGRVWLNPPYSQPHCLNFIERAVNAYRDGEIDAAVVLTNTASETQWWQTIAGAADMIAFPSSRIQFWHPEAEANDSNRYAQTLFYLGPERHRFADVVSESDMLVFQGVGG